MFDQRMQILISAEQRRRLEAEARERKTSVGRLIRDAIDARFGAVTREQRVRAVEEIAKMRGGKFLSVEEMHRLIGEERLANFPELRVPRRSRSR